MISFSKAQRRLVGAMKPLPAVEMDLRQALGLVTTEDVVADRDLPPFDRATMDGYAVVAADTEGAPVRLELAGESLPGHEPDFGVGRGRAARIATGAPLPPGADAVQVVEVCREDGGFVELDEAVEAGENVAPQGEDARAGDVVLAAGMRVTPAALAALASVGKTSLRVGRRPLVAIASTGGEVIPAGGSPTATQIRDANGTSLAARLGRAGAEVRSLGIFADKRAEIDRLLRDVRDADLLVLTGGISMSRHDLVGEVLEEAGAEVVFSKVAIRPGKPTTAAVLNGRPILALPGNPVSCLVTAELFAVPALRALMGFPEPIAPPLRAELKGRIEADANRTLLHPARLDIEHGIPAVRPLRFNSSGDFVGFATAGALVVVPPEAGCYDEAAIVDAIPLEWGGWGNG